jgi:toxin YoeB
MRSVEFKGNSFEEFNDWLLRDKKTYQRIVRMIQECRRTPFEGVGKPEPLKGNLKGFWSRRIDDMNRLVYSVEDKAIVVVSLLGHYD